MDTQTHLLPILIILLGAGIGGFFFVNPINGPTNATGDKTDNQPAEIQKENARTLKLAIDGMFCVGCAQSIENAVSVVPGVAQVDVSLASDSGTVIYDASKVDKEKIIAQPIFRTYPAEIISDTAYSGDRGKKESVKEMPQTIRTKLTRLRKLLQTSDASLSSKNRRRIDAAIKEKKWEQASQLLDNVIANHE